MDLITDGMFERTKDEMKIFDTMDASEAKPLFNSILKMVLSSMLSDQRAKKERHQMKMEELSKGVEKAGLDIEAAENLVHALAVAILQEKRHLVKVSTEVAIIRQELDANSKESHLRERILQQNLTGAMMEVAIVRQELDENARQNLLWEQILQENLAEATFKPKVAELDYIERMRKVHDETCHPAALAPLAPVTSSSIAPTFLPIVEWIQASPCPPASAPPPPASPSVTAHPAVLALPPISPPLPVTATAPRFRVTKLGPPACPTTSRKKKVAEVGL